MKFVFIYITAKNKKEAEAIGRFLVKERLAACVNIIDKIESIYWWEGKIQEDKEVILIAKTKENLTDKLIKAVKQIHSYDCPCIIVLPIVGGNKDYFDWIKKETKK